MPHGDNDGGYAVSDYRAINPDIGTMEALSQLAQRLHQEGISQVLDFVFNHTSNEHQWARRAQEGDPGYWAFYHLFDDRRQPDEYQRHLRDIFPHLFAFLRVSHPHRLLVVNNFSEAPQRMSSEDVESAGFGSGATDLISGHRLEPGADLALDGHRYVWPEASDGK